MNNVSFAKLYGCCLHGQKKKYWKHWSELKKSALERKKGEKLHSGRKREKWFRENSSGAHFIYMTRFHVYVSLFSLTCNTATVVTKSKFANIEICEWNGLCFVHNKVIFQWVFFFLSFALFNAYFSPFSTLDEFYFLSFARIIEFVSLSSAPIIPSVSLSLMPIFFSVPLSSVPPTLLRSLYSACIPEYFTIFPSYTTNSSFLHWWNTRHASQLYLFL